MHYLQLKQTRNLERFNEQQNFGMSMEAECYRTKCRIFQYNNSENVYLFRSNNRKITSKTGIFLHIRT